MHVNNCTLNSLVIAIPPGKLRIHFEEMTIIERSEKSEFDNYDCSNLLTVVRWQSKTVIIGKILEGVRRNKGKKKQFYLGKIW